MAFAITAVKAAPLMKETPFRARFVQILEITITALAADTAFNLNTVAAATSADIGKVVVDALRKTRSIISYNFLESPRMVTPASGAGHVFSGTVNLPVFTFTGTASTPTTMTLVIALMLGDDQDPLIQGA